MEIRKANWTYSRISKSRILVDTTSNNRTTQHILLKAAFGAEYKEAIKRNLLVSIGQVKRKDKKMKELDEVFLLNHTDEIVVRDMLRGMNNDEFKSWLRIGAEFKDTGIYTKETLVKILDFIYGIEEFEDKELILLNLLAQPEIKE